MVDDQSATASTVFPPLLATNIGRSEDDGVGSAPSGNVPRLPLARSFVTLLSS
jgi:hypothetical protein